MSIIEPPIITQDELFGFHNNHFLSEDQVFEYHEDEGEDEEDLGYYENGEKRTLTDEQIAIFRHSEIQQMIKAHLRLEEERTLDTEIKPRTNQPKQTQALLKSQDQTQDQIQNQNQNQTRNQNNRKKRKRKRETEERHNPQNFTDNGDDRTFRRICRELDEHKQEKIDLDY